MNSTYFFGVLPLCLGQLNLESRHFAEAMHLNRNQEFRYDRPVSKGMISFDWRLEAGAVRDS